MNVHRRLAELAQLGATTAGIDRALFTPAEFAARRCFADWASTSGFSVAQDRAGNVFARLAGTFDALPPIQCGSHLDTVKAGGAFDGAFGVVGGLEALERIAARGSRLERSIEVAAWAGEEGSRFPLGCLGSSAFAKLTPLAEICALVGDDGERFADALESPSGLLDDVPLRDGFPTPVAYLELHIEQGPVLERIGARLGVVTAIAGQRRLRVEIAGRPGHAGTQPMAGRADAVCAASEFVLAVERAAREADGGVATVGRFSVEPNQTNTVPGHVSLRVDARAVDDARLAAVEAYIRAAAIEIAQRRGTPIEVELIEMRAAAPMDERLRAILRDVCEQLDPHCIDIASGAGHDAMCLAKIAPAAMIFVPSIGGHSHVAGEQTAGPDLELGIEALATALVAVDREFAQRI